MAKIVLFDERYVSKNLLALSSIVARMIVLSVQVVSVRKKTHSVLRKWQGQGARSPKKRNVLSVHEHFLDERNTEIGVFLETLVMCSKLLTVVGMTNLLLVNNPVKYAH